MVPQALLTAPEVTDMQTIGVRELVNRASALLDAVEEDGEPLVVTRRGRPVAVLSAIDHEAFRDFVLAQAPEFSASRAEADADIDRGVLGTPMDEMFAELDTDEDSSAGQQDVRSA